MKDTRTGKTSAAAQILLMLRGTPGHFVYVAGGKIRDAQVRFLPEERTRELTEKLAVER